MRRRRDGPGILANFQKGVGVGPAPSPSLPPCDQSRSTGRQVPVAPQPLAGLVAAVICPALLWRHVLLGWYEQALGGVAVERPLVNHTCAFLAVPLALALDHDEVVLPELGGAVVARIRSRPLAGLAAGFGAAHCSVPGDAHCGAFLKTASTCVPTVD